MLLNLIISSGPSFPSQILNVKKKQRQIKDIKRYQIVVYGLKNDFFQKR